MAWNSAGIGLTKTNQSFASDNRMEIRGKVQYQRLFMEHGI